MKGHSMTATAWLPLATALPLLLLLTVPSHGARAQDAASVAEGLAKNQAELRQYSWKSTVVSTADGKVEATDVYDNLPDPKEGRRYVRTSTKEAGFSTRGKEEASRRFRKRIQVLTSSYFEAMPPEKLKAVLERATVTPFSGSNYKIEARDVRQKGDAVQMYVDRATLRPFRIDVQTREGGNPMSISAQYLRPAIGAPWAPTKVAVDLTGPKRKMTLTNSDFAKEAVAATAAAP